MSRNVLIFSEPFGLGHERAAGALIKGLKSIDSSFNVLHTNSIRNSFPILTGAFLKIYLKLINTLPQMWHRIYEQGRVNRQSEGTKKFIYRMLANHIKKVVKEFRPDSIVCTHPFPASVVCALKKEGLNVPLAGIITDYDVHAYWLDSQVDLYVVGDKSLEGDFGKYGFNPRMVASTGIPIDPLFRERPTKEQARKAVGMEFNRPSVLVAGGGWGLGDLGGVAKAISRIPVKPQVVVICGTNTKLYKALKSSLAGYDNVRVEGFVENIQEYMAASDVLVSKPGGLTTSEALAAGIPMVLFDVIYGQEMWNARFLTENEAAMKSKTMDDLTGMVENIITNPQIGEKLRKNSLLLGKPESGIKAAEHIVKLIG